MEGIPGSSLCLKDGSDFGCGWEAEEDGGAQTGGGSRTCIMLAVEQVGG